MMLTGICDVSLRWRALIFSPSINLLRMMSSASNKELLVISIFFFIIVLQMFAIFICFNFFLFQRCCHVLKVPLDSDIEEIRMAYITLAKKYHPDSGSPDADPEKFKEVGEEPL